MGKIAVIDLHYCVLCDAFAKKHAHRKIPRLSNVQRMIRAIVKKVGC